jgi:hypothetical protein
MRVRAPVCISQFSLVTSCQGRLPWRGEPLPRSTAGEKRDSVPVIPVDPGPSTALDWSPPFRNDFYGSGLLQQVERRQRHDLHAYEQGVLVNVEARAVPDLGDTLLRVCSTE